jgi:hypothetical protein
MNGSRMAMEGEDLQGWSQMRGCWPRQLVRGGEHCGKQPAF